MAAAPTSFSVPLRRTRPRTPKPQSYSVSFQSQARLGLPVLLGFSDFLGATSKMHSQA